MSAKLEGRVALITGAGSGIGQAMASLFAAEGARVVVADIVSEGVDATVSAVNDAGGNAVGVAGNVALESDVERMIATAIDNYGRLDILCNNAGIMDRMLTVTEITDEFWERLMNVNLTGPFRMCRKAIPIMLEQGKGVILNTSSLAGLCGGRAGVAYTTSKHGLVGLTKNIAWTYADKGIRCNAICPGAVETAIGIGGDVPSEFGFARMQLGTCTIPRAGKSEELASVALMLVSDDGSFVNGAIVTVDGGWTAY